MTDYTIPTARGDVASLRARYAGVLERIEAACLRVGRDPPTVSVLPITKGVSIELVGAAVMVGMTVLGENRVQEAEPKVRAIPGVHWELVGRLQSNKARRAVELFDTIQSVDSVDLAARLGQLAREVDDRSPLRIYLQVNVDRDAAKAGFDPDDLETVLPRIADIGGVEVRGLMTVGRLAQHTEDTRPTFRALRELSERLRGREPRLGADLSMGMSDDFEIAVEEGATIVRIGRGLFGERGPG